MSVANEWWATLDPKNLREVPKRAFGQFLMQKGIIKKELEGERVLKAMIDE